MTTMSRVGRKNAGVLRWLRAVAFALIVFAGLTAMPFYPSVLVPVLAVACAVLALFAPPIAVIAAVIVLSLPIMGANLAAGIVFLVVGLAASQFLGQDGARAFLVVGLAFALAALGQGWSLAWAVVALAGLFLGAGDGAVSALIACLVIQIVAIVFGYDTLGVLATGGATPALVAFEGEAGQVVVAGQTYSAMSLSWFVPAFSAIEVSSLVDAISGVRYVALLVVQPIVWGGGAALSGSIARPPGDPKRTATAFGSVAAGILAVAAVSIAASFALSGPVATSVLAQGALASLVLGMLVVAVSEFVFTPQVSELTVASPSLRAEDADVDELLRALAEAEDALAAKHTVQATVMITDMKSFSKLTQIDGSVLTAKTIQRHRDLLLPLVTKNEGKGKSTGGDGLLARFDRPGDAVEAAVEMQRKLTEHNARHPSDRSILIRVGIASGELVVDKSGRPFIGDGLNKAARIMDLADGGQIFVTGQVMESVPAPPPTHDHGPHEVKNIAEPLQVLEILWREGQEPMDPSSTKSGSGIEPPASDEVVGGSD
jgi:class 3 adenylate cyclase